MMKNIKIGDIVVFQYNERNHIKYQNPVNVGKVYSIDEDCFDIEVIDSKGNIDYIHENQIQTTFYIVSFDKNNELKIIKE